MSAKTPYPQTKENKSDFGKSFQFKDADIILRADGVDFKLHMSVLTHVSVIFKDMFSLPRERERSQEGIPVVEITEDAQTLRDVLSLIYLGDHDVDLDNVSTIHRVLLVSRKYLMDRLRSTLLKILETKVHADPLQTFAVACHVRAPEVARLAAKQTLRQSYFQIIEHDSPDMGQIRARTLCKLLRYHTKCGSIASEAIRDHASQCPVDKHNSYATRNTKGQNVDCRQSWWNAYIDHIDQDSKLCPIQSDYKSIELVKKFCPPASGPGYCSTCSPVAFMRLIELGEQLERAVREVVTQVQLDLNDDDFLV